MKAEICGYKEHYFWLIKSRNGVRLARSLCFYTRRDNAVRGLRNFLRKTVRATMCKGELYELYCGVK